MSDFIQDRNQQYTSGGAQGTLGTADIKGTAGVVSFAANPDTGAQYVEILAGTIAVSTPGTITSGSIAITAGTIGAGSIQTNHRPAVQAPLTVGAVGTAAIGTLIAAPGAGTSTFLTGLSMKVGSGTLDLMLGFGTAESGATVLERALISPTSGVVREFSMPNNGNVTNTAVVYKIISGAGTAYWNAQYFTAV